MCVVACCLQVYAAIKQEIASGGRAYIVCPLVSESDSDAMAGVRTVEEEFARLSGSGALQQTVTCWGDARNSVEAVFVPGVKLHTRVRCGTTHTCSVSRLGRLPGWAGVRVA